MKILGVALLALLSASAGDAALVRVEASGRFFDDPFGAAVPYDVSLLVTFETESVPDIGAVDFPWEVDFSGTRNAFLQFVSGCCAEPFETNDFSIQGQEWVSGSRVVLQFAGGPGILFESPGHSVGENYEALLAGFPDAGFVGPGSRSSFEIPGHPEFGLGNLSLLPHTVTLIPEPSTGILIIGAAGLVLSGRRRRGRPGHRGAVPA